MPDPVHGRKRQKFTANLKSQVQHEGRLVSNYGSNYGSMINEGVHNEVVFIIFSQYLDNVFGLYCLVN